MNIIRYIDKLGDFVLKKFIGLILTSAGTGMLVVLVLPGWGFILAGIMVLVGILILAGKC